MLTPVVHSPRKRRSFTLIETMLAIVVVSVGFVGAMMLTQSSVRTYSANSQYAIAAQLANNIREIIYKTPGYGEIDLASSISCLNGKSFNPPISHCPDKATLLRPVSHDNGWVTLPDSRYPSLPDLSKYTQTISVRKVSASDLRTTSSTETGLKSVTVTITYKSTPTANPVTVYTLSFLLCSLN